MTLTMKPYIIPLLNRSLSPSPFIPFFPITKQAFPSNGFIPSIVECALYESGTRGDGLRIELSAVESPSFHVIGSLPGVAVLAAAGANGPGTGDLESEDGGTKLKWKAPDSGTHGTSVDVSTDGSYILEDGEDERKWVRVQVVNSFMLNVPMSTFIYLSEVYENAVSSDDVTAAEATAGDTKDYTVDIKAESPMDLLDVKVWLESPDDGIFISDDGVVYVQPKSEGADALSFARIASGATQSLFLRRITSAGASASTGILNRVRFAWDGY